MNMRRSILILVSIVIFIWCARPGMAQTATGSATSTAGKTHSASAKKTAAHKRRRTSKKFVPKQKAPTADRITEIQTALAHGGYYEGDPNGKWDANAIAALQKFQSANGIEPTGKLDAPSLQKLGLGSDIAGVSAPRPVTPTSTTPQSGAPQTAAPPASSSTTSAPPATAAALASSSTIAAKPSQQ